MILEWIALIVTILLIVLGIILTLFGLPGTFLIAITGGIYNLITWSWTISIKTIILLFGLAIAGEILEMLITIKSKTSKQAIIGSIIGAIVGATILSIIPIIGTLIGLLLGAMIGAAITEYARTENIRKALKSAKTILVSRAIITLTKFTIAIIQIILILRSIV